MAKILTTKNLPDIKEKAKDAIKTNINDNFENFSNDNTHTDKIPIQNIYFKVGDLSPNFVYYELGAMRNTETYKAFVSVGNPETNEDPLVYKVNNKMQDLSDAKFWPANSDTQIFRNKKDINITLYFHNTFGTRGKPGNSPDNAATNAAEYIGRTGSSDYLGNYMKFDASTGTLSVRTTDVR